MNLPSRPSELIQSVQEILRQGELLLAEVSDEIYTCKVPLAFNASIGGHYRHCLDHFRSLLRADATGGLDYDQRERGTLVERDRFAALNATRELRAAYQQLDPATLARALAVTGKTSYAAAGAQTADSTVGREIMYAVAHAVHHYALIGVMAAIMKIALPAGFGVAPATLKHQETSVKAA